MSITDFFLNKAINSGFLKSRIQSWARIGATAGAAYLVNHGLANHEIALQIVGAVTGLVALYLQDLDVKVVDGKLKIALASGKQTPEEEVEETRQLNLTQNKG